jgi:hypothetical protein
VRVEERLLRFGESDAMLRAIGEILDRVPNPPSTKALPI